MVHCPIAIDPDVKLRAAMQQERLFATVTAEQLAKVFSQTLHAWLGARTMRLIVRLNKSEPSKDVCHSHDFCDANMAMATVFDHYGLDIDLNKAEHIALWAAAWDAAILSNFEV